MVSGVDATLVESALSMSRSARKPTHKHSSAAPQTISGRWLAKAMAIVILAALVCSYLSLCLLYRIGQWQIVLHPDRAARSQSAPADMLRFGPDESGRPQLTGEFLVAPPGGRYNSVTILFLGGGDGSRKNYSDTVAALNYVGLNVLWFDYRGYGLSADIHPNQQRLMEDADSAWSYLTGTRGVAPQRIIPYGTGVGASLAAALAAKHGEIQAVILDSPFTDLLEVARKDSRSGLLPISMLFNERFPLAAPLATLQTPKLLLSPANKPEPAAFAAAATPKMAVSLPTGSWPLYDQAVTRFLDQYVAVPGGQVVPSVAPVGTKTR